MNWSDLIVIAVILLFGLIGMSKGLILSLFKIVSFFIAAFVSVKFYPKVASFLEKTAIFTDTKAGIYKNLINQQSAQEPTINESAKLTAQSVIDNLNLPGFIKEMIGKNIPDVTKIIDVSKVLESISDILAHMVVDIISVILLYIAVRIGLHLVRIILQGIAQLPVLKQMDKLGGFAFGALEGLLAVYVIFALLVIFHATPAFADLFDAVEGSLIAKSFYQNNFIIDWIFSKGTIV